MYTGMNQVECKHDNVLRDSDLSKPCPGCGSRKYPLIGYRYPYEARQLLVLAISIGVIVFVALIAGVGFFIWTRIQFPLGL